ncbi:Cell cycle serine/threonine-protein kinase cdc5/MSD2 [Allomyces arbusculus]|nr:Cell cycle serine/threonine-protein kinase cdc5/MSD2 [Allomyces arbusculus]
MRVVIKGGVWKNTEDEILKVAVMKYGKNQWARISSLLTRKTPKQCKARWYEWLDPSIKKTEWSKDEDEKLLHLAKLMPTQWRTIAPIVGRTPAQCLDRYQKLLDDAERDMAAGTSSGAAGGTENPDENPEAQPPIDDVRRLRPGEIDPDPETKPARPDPVDMDEDEKEMLSEARARLANTQGKKAKRKARERQLEESRRLAALQKRRELKAAGIIVGKPRARKDADDMDYNTDIPFQRAPMPGFYDTADELNKPSGQSLGDVLLSQLEGKRKAEREADARKRDAKKRKLREEREGVAFVAAGTKAATIFGTEKTTKRAPLHLPAPQVTTEEIERLAKMGATAVPVDVDMSGPESDLVSEYAMTPVRMPQRTPRMAVVDSVRQQARALVQARDLNTPLLGEVQPEHQLEPATSILPPSQTPRAGVSMTPSVAATPRTSASATPYRDRMGINTPSHAESALDTPRDARHHLRARNQLKQALLSLPKPKNDFQIVVPDSSASEAESAAGVRGGRRADRSDLEKAELAAAAQAAEAAQLLRSQAVARNLPRPMYLPTLDALLEASLYPPSSALFAAETLVAREMIALLARDALEYPVAGAPPVDPVDYTDVTVTQLTAARDLIDAHLPADIPLVPIPDAADLVLDARTGLVYAAHDVEDWVAVHSAAYAVVAEAATRAAKVEKRATVTLGGYMARAQALATKLRQSTEALHRHVDDFAAVQALRVDETRAIPIRLQEAEQEVLEAKREQREVQARYQELMAEWMKLGGGL